MEKKKIDCSSWGGRCKKSEGVEEVVETFAATTKKRIIMYGGNTFKNLESVTTTLLEPAPPVANGGRGVAVFNSKNKPAVYHHPPPPQRIVNASSRSRKHEKFEKTPLFLKLAGYVSYVFLFIVGYARELIWGMGPLGSSVKQSETNRFGYAPLYAGFESFYIRNVYRRLKDVFNRPIGSVPGAKITLVNRESKDHFWTWKMLNTKRQECINFASYNYLGFAESSGPCTDEVIAGVSEYGMTCSSSRNDIGTHNIHRQLEATVAQFLGTEDALTVGMGFATNTLNLPCLISKKCLVLSDEKNHASLILGLRLSGATVKVFKHNSPESLEKMLRKAVLTGHPRTRRPFKKIFIVVEGVYSMEGSIVRLPEIVAIKKKYKAYLYLDEAHSVGAMGLKGRGVVDYFGINPTDIDILMGTFTKSFGGAGGYIAGSKALISYLRTTSHAFNYSVSLSPAVAQQIISSMHQIIDRQSGSGMNRIKQLARNSRYFRQRLRQKGFFVYGHDDSPVVPIMLFMPAKISAFVNGLLERGIASIGVGFPATSMTEERARFCISASHTKKMLDEALEAIDEVGTRINIKYSKKRKYKCARIVY